MAKKYAGILSIIVPALVAGILCVLLWQRLQLGLVRYFDADEFAYLHWAHNVFTGRIPIVDFLLYTPPGFLYILAPLFWFADGVDILTVSRLFAFVVFFGLTGMVIALYWQLRKSRWAIVAGLFLVFLPLPADKFLEVRPDTLAVLIACIGMIFEIRWMTDRGARNAVLSGIFLTGSLLILPKTLPQVVVACAVGAGWLLFGNAGAKKERIMSGIFFAAGLAAPILLFLLWIAAVARSVESFDFILYSLTKLPFEVNRLGEIFGMQPDLFFYPNSTYYGASGWNKAVIVNHIVWGIGLVWGAIRLVTPVIPNGKKGAWAEVLVAGTFFAYILSFLYGYPMRHAQYLIPIAVFVAFYVTDAIRLLVLPIVRYAPGKVVGIVSGTVGLYVLYTISIYVQQPKLAMTNTADRRQLEYALATIPAGSYVLDMTGATIYFRDPYIASAVTFGEWEQFLSRQFPSLSEALEKTGTKYIYQDLLNRIGHLSTEDRVYIAEHFVASTDWGLMVRR